MNMSDVKRYLRILARRFWKHRLMISFIIFILVMLINALAFYWTEVINGPQKHLTFFHAVYWAIISITTIGYGDIIPVTEAGKMIAIETGIMGFVVFMLLVSTMAEYLMEYSLKKSMGLGKLSDVDLIVVGSSEICREAINEIKANSPKTKIGWILEKRPRTPPEDVEFIVGDPTDDKTLLRAGIKKAKHMIICLTNDSKALHIVLTAKRLNKNLNIISIAMNRKSQELLEEAGAKMVIPLRIIGRALASAVFEPLVSDFLDKITAAKTLNLTEHDVTAHEKDMSVSELVKSLESKDNNYRYVPLVLARKDGKELIAPGKEAKLSEGDRLVLLKIKKRKPRKPVKKKTRGQST